MTNSSLVSLLKFSNCYHNDYLFQGPGVPSSAIYRIGTGHKLLEPIFFIQNNTRLRDRISQIALPQVKTFPVMISGGYHAQVRLYLPPGLREDEITRYPLILHV